jgi:cell division transport system ATP-binding protein
MEFKNVAISYNERTILKDISFKIEPWEFVFLIGSSGSGKTSLIRSIIWLVWVRNGTIFDDIWRDISHLKPKELLNYRRNIWVIFQDFKLLPRKTVKENVSFALEVSGYSRSEIQKKLHTVLTEVWLLAKRDKFIETLSGWEIQRVCIARALIHSPSIIIWDEPTGNLDRKNANDVMDMLLKLNAEWKTIIMATHDEHIVNSMEKRVITFHDGKIIKDEKKWTYSLPTL